MNEQLQTLYKRLEMEYEIEGLPLTLFPDLGTLSEENRLKVRYEFLALNEFKSDLFNDEKINIVSITNYIEDRVRTVKNPHLLASYNQFLLNISRNYIYVNYVIENYQKILSNYLLNSNQGFNALDFSNILEKIIILSTKYKVDDDLIKTQINNYLTNKDIPSKIKTFVLEIISKRKHKLFKSSELSCYPQICIDLAIKEKNVNIKKRLLKTAVILSQKTSDRKNYKIANELLGDLEYSHLLPINDNNIANSHLNVFLLTTIIKYYNLAGQREKKIKAIKEFKKNKEQHQYFKIQYRTPCSNIMNTRKLINLYIKTLLDFSSERFILMLCFDNGLLLFPSIKVETIKNQFKTHKYLLSKMNDFNNNTTSVEWDRLIAYEIYNIYINELTLPFIIELLEQAFDKKKIGYSQIKKTLEKSAFGISIDVKRGDSIFSYTWFTQINIGIREFFKQFNKYINIKQPDWRFTIDYLTPRFESIFREIVEIAGGTITKVNENGDSELKTLENLVSSTEIKKFFNDDDIFLFKHTFTKIGWNIRNNVAHGLYKSFDYTLPKAILVFLCILRLNKVPRYIINKRDQY